MNDDITSREMELVDAILSALCESADLWRPADPDENREELLKLIDRGYYEGYKSATTVVIDVLATRGFEVNLTAKEPNDCTWNENQSIP